MVELAGKVAIVTGSTRGIGRAIAEALWRAGATVVVTATGAHGQVPSSRELQARVHWRPVAAQSGNIEIPAIDLRLALMAGCAFAGINRDRRFKTVRLVATNRSPLAGIF